MFRVRFSLVTLTLEVMVLVLFQLTNPDEFSKIQRSAISFVENSPQQVTICKYTYL